LILHLWIALQRKIQEGRKVYFFHRKRTDPHIDSLYPTQPYRTFIGIPLVDWPDANLVHHTSLFNAYIAIDPSMWWDNQRLLTETKKALEEKKFTGTSLYLGIANTMEDGMEYKKVKKDTSARQSISAPYWH
jgi:predicted alpha/beta superfamily hydrolase